jgi:transcriptional regulator with XRE-family HTH domain
LRGFSKVLAYHRLEKNLTIEMVADASELSASQLADWENTITEPDVTDFFHLASALGIDPTILFIDVVTEWRRDPTDIGLYKSRVSGQPGSTEVWTMPPR